MRTRSELADSIVSHNSCTSALVRFRRWRRRRRILVAGSHDGLRQHRDGAEFRYSTRRRIRRTPDRNGDRIDRVGQPGRSRSAAVSSRPVADQQHDFRQFGVRGNGGGLYGHSRRVQQHRRVQFELRRATRPRRAVSTCFAAASSKARSSRAIRCFGAVRLRWTRQPAVGANNLIGVSTSPAARHDPPMIPSSVRCRTMAARPRRTRCCREVPRSTPATTSRN